MLDLTPETEALARSLAAKRKLSVDALVRGALESRRFEPSRAKGKDMSAEAVAVRKVQIQQIVDDIAALPILDNRPVSEIIEELNAL